MNWKPTNPLKRRDQKVADMKAVWAATKYWANKRRNWVLLPIKVLQLHVRRLTGYKSVAVAMTPESTRNSIPVVIAYMIRNQSISERPTAVYLDLTLRIMMRVMTRATRWMTRVAVDSTITSKLVRCTCEFRTRNTRLKEQRGPNFNVARVACGYKTSTNKRAERQRHSRANGVKGAKSNRWHVSFLVLPASLRLRFRLESLRGFPLYSRVVCR